MKQVTIWIEGGVIQNMNAPEGVTVVTYDFDTDGALKITLPADEKARTALLRAWREGDWSDEWWSTP